MGALRSSGALLDAGGNQRAWEWPLHFNFADCGTNPKTCGAAVDSMANLSSTILNKTATDHKQMMQRVAQVIHSFVRCHQNLTGKGVASKKGFDSAKKGHKDCRVEQSAKAGALRQCQSTLAMAKNAQKSACED